MIVNHRQQTTAIKVFVIRPIRDTLSKGMAANSSRRLKRIIQSVAGIFAEPSAIHPAIPTRLDYHTSAEDIVTQPTGFRPLDKALGIGGLPQGKITELMGPGVTPASGGTTCIAARIAAKVQRQQDMVTIIDMNHSVDPWQAERCGLIAPHLLLTRPDTVYDVITTLEKAARNTKLIIVVMGVVKELLRHVEPDLLKTLLRRLQNIVNHSDCAFLFITAPPQNDPFSPLNYPAGFPLAEIADVRLWVQDENWTHKAGLATAYKATLTVVKNRLDVAGKGANINIKLNGS